MRRTNYVRTSRLKQGKEENHRKGNKKGEGTDKTQASSTIGNEKNHTWISGERGGKTQMRKRSTKENDRKMRKKEKHTRILQDKTKQGGKKEENTKPKEKNRGPTN